MSADIVMSVVQALVLGMVALMFSNIRKHQDETTNAIRDLKVDLNVVRTEVMAKAQALDDKDREQGRDILEHKFDIAGLKARFQDLKEEFGRMREEHERRGKFLRTIGYERSGDKRPEGGSDGRD